MYDYGYDEQGTSEALAALSLQAGDDPTFYADSGATTHMTNDVGKLISAHTYNGRDAIYVGNGNKLPISHTGNALLKTSHGNLKLKDVLVVPKLRKNLLSVSQLTHDNVSLFAFDANGFVIKDQNQRTLAKGHKKGQLYALDEAQALVLVAIKTP